MSDRAKADQQRREQEERQQRQREEHDRAQAARQEKPSSAPSGLPEHPGRATGLETGPNNSPDAIPQTGRPGGAQTGGAQTGGAGAGGAQAGGAQAGRSQAPGARAGGDAAGRREQAQGSPTRERVPAHLTNPGAALLGAAGAREGEEEDGEQPKLDPASAPDSPNHPYDPGAALRTGAPVEPAEAPTEAPSVTDVPTIIGDPAVGNTLNCTMGNWVGEPTEYAYQWQRDGADIEATGDSYVIAAEDAGTSLSCTVTATNAIGSTTAPPSNAVAVPAAAGRSGSGNQQRR
jgi:hypothetical protein